tara:strand:+ start:865 stop:1383 length:519 start_codon:yes stop_codon:yes gene_type:complete
MSQIKVNSIVPAGGLPSGSNGGIIQVVSTTKTDTTSSSSSSFADITGMSVTITPSTNSSKIYLVGYVNTCTNDARNRVYFKITGGNCSNYLGDAATGHETANVSPASYDNFAYMQTSVPFHFLDSPATTSAVTYQIQWAVEASQTAYLNRAYNVDSNSANTASTFTAYEVST